MATALDHANANELANVMDSIGRAARGAARHLAMATTQAKNTALHGAAASLRDRMGEIGAANARDLENGRAKGLSDAQLDRLKLDAKRIEAMAAGYRGDRRPR